MSKNKKIKQYIFLTGVLFLFPLAWLIIFGILPEHKFNTLPYLGPRHAANQAPGDTSAADTIYHSIPSFSLINHESQPFNQDSLKGKVWLASLFGTNSKYIGNITQQLLWPNWRYRNEDDLLMLSISLDPEYDSPERLKKFVDEVSPYQELESRWQFLTGEMKDIDQLIRKGFLLEDYENTSYFFLIDTEGHLRGRYDGNKEDAIKEAIEDMALLKKELDVKAYEARKN